MTKTCSGCGETIPDDAPSGLCPHCLLRGAAAPDSRSPETPSIENLPALLPGYVNFEFIGRGGMGIVFAATQEKLGRRVAIKILPRGGDQDVEFEARFEREARTLASLSHPNILTLFDYGKADGWHYLITEFVEGSNLRTKIAAGRTPPVVAIDIVRQVCEALSYAHERGVIHRDIKPENILVGNDGRVRVADFGLAKLVGPAALLVPVTQSEQRVGTPHYMAPEQTEGKLDVDARADLFAVGVVFYELLTGELPLGNFARPSEKARCDPRIDRVVMRALQRDVAKRFESAREMLGNVTAVAATMRRGAVPPRSDLELEDPPREFRLGVAVIGALLVAAAFADWMVWKPAGLPVVRLNAWQLVWTILYIPIPCWVTALLGGAILGSAVLERAEWMKPNWLNLTLCSMACGIMTLELLFGVGFGTPDTGMEATPGWGLIGTLILCIIAFYKIPANVWRRRGHPKRASALR